MHVNKNAEACIESMLDREPHRCQDVRLLCRGLGCDLGPRAGTTTLLVDGGEAVGWLPLRAAVVSPVTIANVAPSLPAIDFSGLRAAAVCGRRKVGLRVRTYPQSLVHVERAFQGRRPLWDRPGPGIKFVAFVQPSR